MLEPEKNWVKKRRTSFDLDTLIESKQILHLFKYNEKLIIIIIKIVASNFQKRNQLT